MSRKRKFIEKLTEAQKRALEKGYRTGKSHLIRRKCHCILLSHEGKAVKELKEFFGVSAHSIYAWFKLWETEGIKGLKLKPGRGRPPKLDLTNEQQVKKIKTLVENEPQNLNRVVDHVKSKMDIDLSKKTLQRFLKNLNMSGNSLGAG
ncbi:MAG: helix-turn-helix domain-containing protein [Bacteroidetes bacterium]|nr:helix-turn-helix domain-containing protein [Bacteroidota bacterium]